MTAKAPSTRSPNGLTNASPGQTLADAGQLDPTWSHTYSNDFDTFAAGDWTITKVGTGTVALAAGQGGRLLLTNTTGAADAIYIQTVVAGFGLPAGKDVFFKFSGQLSAIVNDVFYAGLIMTSATPLTANDGLYILKPTGAAALQLKSVIGGVATTVAFPTLDVPVAATDFEVGFHVTSTGDVEAFFNPTTGAPSTTFPGVRARLLAPTLTAVNLAPSFGLLNSTGVANTLNADYVVAVQNR